LIVAADVLHQETGGNVSGSSFDELVTVDFLKAVAADAIKFLVIWRAGSGQAERAELVQRAIDLAQAAGVASLVEAIVRTDDDSPWGSQAERHEAILAAAEEIAPFGADVYKAEVPGYAPGDLSKVTEHSERLTAVVPNDWVVLSNGVDRPDFAGAVAAACAGGANGFLAGRAIWADVIGHDDTSDRLRDLSIPRLNDLAAIVDAR
jgi:sulfofructosephosphate aldolase